MSRYGDKLALRENVETISSCASIRISLPLQDYIPLGCSRPSEGIFGRDINGRDFLLLIGMSTHIGPFCSDTQAFVVYSPLKFLGRLSLGPSVVNLEFGRTHKVADQAVRRFPVAVHALALG